MNRAGSPMACGVEVVKLGGAGGAKYSLDEEALSSVLLREDVRDRSVVLVSVAGTYRGGKSFILDLFLRYLTAPRSSQLSGEWLDIHKERLEGFAWRGGCDRHTTGIHLWSEPVLIDLPNGKKVAVLLMDTQGTFDHESTLADNSMIFALSTLMSSVQIYNLSSNIRENDLQHLQLFTEYGKLASDGKAFQTLIFLVRDWMFDDEHAYGFGGGYEMLEKRLEAKENQKKELSQVREHIRSCFDSLKCFLMPHPGLVVGKRTFTGRLKDLTDEFRMSLLQLVPSLFDPEFLSMKLINGEPVKAKHLVDLFKKYVEIFNSNDLPEAKTIFQATADASMMTTLRDASELYQQAMDSNMQGELTVTSSGLQNWHNDAKQSALDFFRSKKKLSSKEAIDAADSQLQMELEARLSTYTLINNVKTRDRLEEAERLYDSVVESVCTSVSQVCMHPVDLRALHERASEDAVDCFSATRATGYEDEECDNLQEKLRNKYLSTLFPSNDRNNLTAVRRCRESYMTQMWSCLSASPALSTEALQHHHESIQAEAVALFHSLRNVSTQEMEDHYCDRLIQETADVFKDCENMNQRYNLAMLHVACTVYNEHWSNVWAPRASCFHPDAMLEEHNTARDAALQHFLQKESDQHNGNRDRLIEILENRFTDLQAVNRTNNERAVELAFGKYREMMDKLPPSSALDLLLIPLFVRLAMYPNAHRNAKKAAIKFFNSKRIGETVSPDTYLDALTARMEAAAGYRTQ